MKKSQTVTQNNSVISTFHYVKVGKYYESNCILSHVDVNDLAVQCQVDAPRKICRSDSQEMSQCLVMSAKERHFPHWNQ